MGLEKTERRKAMEAEEGQVRHGTSVRGIWEGQGGPVSVMLSQGRDLKRLRQTALTPAHSYETGRASPAQTQAILVMLFGQQPGQK